MRILFNYFKALVSIFVGNRDLVRGLSVVRSSDFFLLW